ncbi:MAG: hypothetical protein WC916_04130 [Candidatus Woesearchaeota archaeon]
MDHIEARKLLEKYFQSWLKKDVILFKKLLDKKIIVRECYGPVYKGINANLKWFNEWNKAGKVIHWNILDFSYDPKNNKMSFEWDFKYKHDGYKGRFLGCSFIILKNDKFISINEYKKTTN